jgi:hypothetical protein
MKEAKGKLSARPRSACLKAKRTPAASEAVRKIALSAVTSRGLCLPQLHHNAVAHLGTPSGQPEYQPTNPERPNGPVPDGWLSGSLLLLARTGRQAYGHARMRMPAANSLQWRG